MAGISALNNTSTESAAGANAFSELSSEEFVKIMFAELSNQDPLKPNDSTQMLEQLSSLRSIQSDMNLTEKLESILTQNQLSTAGTLIGKYVSGLTEGGQRVIGEVVSVARNADGPILRLSNNFLLPFSNVDIMENGLQAG
jgi:flagellar basal-body rod modification protein FlgD